ncbi:MAG: RNA polymerase sigma-70 factor [Cyclobacteriaceae bacterium]
MENNFDQIDDSQLMDFLSNDNKQAFEHIFRTYYQDLCRFGATYVKDPDVAEELVQQIFINIWERRYELTISTSMKSYLFTAVRNKSFNYLKLQLPKEYKKVDVDNVGFLDPTNKEEDIVYEDLKAYVSEAIDALPAKCKTIFNLSRNSGLTYKEIAEELDISVKTVENQIGIALKKLREQLSPVWDKVIIILTMMYYNF